MIFVQTAFFIIAKNKCRSRAVGSYHYYARHESRINYGHFVCRLKISTDLDLRELWYVDDIQNPFIPDVLQLMSLESIETLLILSQEKT